MPFDLCISISLTSGGGPAGAAAPSLPTDNFNDNSRNVAIWNVGHLRAASATVGTVSETNSRLEIAPPVSTAGLNYNGFVTVGTFDMTGKALYVRTSDFSLLSANTEAAIAFGPDVNNSYMAIWSGGQLFLKQTKAGVETNSGGLVYVTASHACLRVRHGGAGDDNIYFDTAPSSASNPPIGGDWTQRATMVRDAAIALTACKLSLFAGTWGSNATPGTPWFDGFNTAT